MWTVLVLISVVEAFISARDSTVFVGQLLHYELDTAHNVLTDAAGDALPSWIFIDPNGGGGGFSGIPQIGDVGVLYLKVTNTNETGIDEDVVEVHVKEEVTSECGEKAQTFWILIEFDTALRNLNVSEQMKLMKNVSKRLNTPLNSLRLYNVEYSERIRESRTLLTNDLGSISTPDNVLISWLLTCGEDVDEALERADLVESVFSNSTLDDVSLVRWQLVHGSLVIKKHRRHEDRSVSSAMLSAFTTDLPFISGVALTRQTTTSSKRTTRRADSRPIRLNSLDTFLCTRGVFCQLEIPSGTFMDAEDGDTSRLNLSVHSVGGNDSWLLVDGHRLLGVALNVGQFEFRLEARDSANQPASAPFHVRVEQATREPIHNFRFALENPKIWKSGLGDFVRRLSDALGDPEPKHISVNSVATNGTKTLITWSNNTLSTQVCQDRLIDQIKHKMVTKKRPKPRIDFVKSMGADWHVIGVDLLLTGACLHTLTTTPSSTSPISNIVDASPVSFDALRVVLPGVLLLLLILLLLLCLLFCCIIRRRSRKQQRSSQFGSKSVPVVFPEEVPVDGAEDQLASSPMLTKEERPPLLITQSQNLYKAPAPLSTASPRPRLSASTQRLPPPYMPP